MSRWDGCSKCVARLRMLGTSRGHVLEGVSWTVVVATTAGTVRIRALRFKVTDVFATMSDNWLGQSERWLDAGRDVEVVDELLCVIRVEVEAMNKECRESGDVQTVGVYFLPVRYKMFFCFCFYE